MEKRSNAIVKSKTPEEKQQDYLDFGATVAKYYRIIPDPQQLAMDAKVYLAANLTHESLTAAFESYLGLKDSLYPPRPGQLIELVRSQSQGSDLGGFKPSKAQSECELCYGSGWRDATKPVDKSRSVVRCECRRAQAERVSK